MIGQHLANAMDLPRYDTDQDLSLELRPSTTPVEIDVPASQATGVSLGCRSIHRSGYPPARCLMANGACTTRALASMC